MICQQCGEKNEPDAVFCMHCSYPLSHTCPSCRTQNPAIARFCKKCGVELDDSAYSAQTSRLQALRHSASENLQEKLRLAETEIEGQRKPVTILFTDIVGSTSIAETLDPEEWKEVVQGAHQRVSEAVHRYEGTIAQLLGDGVLAFFGAPLTHEDDPERAVRAALDLQESLDEYRKTLASFVDAFHMRIGIHTGEVVVGPVGAEGHIEYLAIGDAVNIAARMEQAAQPDQVLISQACARFIEHAFELGDFKPIQAKGKAESVKAAGVLRLKAEPGLARGLGGVRTPFVGRETELAQMQDALIALCQGQGGIVTLVGEAGIGKSRLLEEVRETTCKGDQKAGESHFDPQTIRWLEGRALSYGGALSFWIIRQLLLADLGLSDGTSQVKIKAALRSRINDLFGEKQGEAVLPYLVHLMDIKLVDQEATPIKDMDGEAIKYQALIYLAEYFERAASDKPTVLIFEDLHWADPSSLEALEKLTPLTNQVPLLFMLLMRIEREHGSWALKTSLENDYPHRTTEIELRRLDESDSQLLIEQLLRPEVIPENVRQLILTRSEGNPFYLEEVVRHLLESGLVVEKDGEWVATEGLAEIGVPETLQGVLLARIDRLEEDVRDTLQMAAVIGKSFLYKLLDAISDAEQALETHLSQLQRMDLVREKARLPDLEYIFKHSLTQEAAYNSLLVERRKAFHRKVGEALEELFPDRQEEYLGLLGHHFRVAGEHEKAANYLILAGDKARMADGYDEAIDLYYEVLPLLEEIKDPSRARRLWLDIGLSYHINSKYLEAKQAYENFNTFSETNSIKPKIIGQEIQSVENRRSITIPGNPSWIQTFDPGKTNFEGDIITNCFTGLTRIEDMMSIKPHLARSWDVSDDGKQYIFHLRDDAYWTDGTKISADQFVWAWLRNLSPDEGCFYAWCLDDILGAQEYRTGTQQDPNTIGIRVLDPLTLEVNLVYPANYFLYIVALPITFPLPFWVIEQHGDEWWKPENIVSNGPFSLKYFDSEGVVLRKNYQYFDTVIGNLEEIKTVTMQEEDPVKLWQLMNIAYQEDKIDFSVVSFDELPHDFPSFHQHTVPINASAFLFLNPCVEPLDQILIRKAIAQVIDPSIHDFQPLFFTPATGGLVHPRTPGHSPAIKPKSDIATAQALMEEAGYPRGESILELHFAIVTNPVGRTVSQGIANQLEEVLRIKVKIVEVENFETSPVHHLRLGVWLPDYPDPDSLLRRSIISSWIQESGYKRSEHERLLHAAGDALDRKERLSHYRRLDRWLVAEEYIYVPLRYGTERLEIWRPNIKNIPYTHFGLENVIIED